MANTRNDPYGRHRANTIEYGIGGEEGYRRRCQNPFPYLRERFACFRELRNDTQRLIDLKDGIGLQAKVKTFMTIDIEFDFDDDHRNNWFRTGILTVTRHLLTENLPPKYNCEVLMEIVERVVVRDPMQSPHHQDIHQHHYTFSQVVNPTSRQVLFTIFECLNLSCRLVETVYAFLGIPKNLECLEVGI